MLEFPFTAALRARFPPKAISIEASLIPEYLRTRRWTDEYGFANGTTWEELSIERLEQFCDVLFGLNDEGFRSIVPGMIDAMFDPEYEGRLITDVPYYLRLLSEFPDRIPSKVSLGAEERVTLGEALDRLAENRGPTIEPEYLSEIRTVAALYRPS